MHRHGTTNNIFVISFVTKSIQLESCKFVSRRRGSWFLRVERDPRIVDHVKERKPPHGASSHVKSLLAMIGLEAKISKDGTSAIPFHLTTLVCHLGCNYEQRSPIPPPFSEFPPPFFSPNMNSSPSRERITTNPPSSPRYLAGRRKSYWVMLFFARKTRIEEFSLDWWIVGKFDEKVAR